MEIKFTTEERNFLMEILGKMQLNPLAPGALEVVQKVNILAGKINALTAEPDAEAKDLKKPAPNK